MNKTSQLLALDVSLLDQITGGTAGAVKQPMPVTPNMGFPKYSAGWWDIVRSRGLGK